jgi:hypothetical protein
MALAVSRCFVAPREVLERIAEHPINRIDEHPINRIDELPPWNIVRRQDQWKAA